MVGTDGVACGGAMTADAALGIVFTTLLPSQDMLLWCDVGPPRCHVFALL